MDVEIRLFGPFRDAVGGRSVVRTYDEPADVRTALRDLEESYPGLAGSLVDDEGDQPEALAVVLNGRNVVHEQGFDTALSDGDVLGVMPPLAGGSRGPLRR